MNTWRSGQVYVDTTGRVKNCRSSKTVVVRIVRTHAPLSSTRNIATCALLISSAERHRILQYFTDDRVNRRCNSCASALAENGPQQATAERDTTDQFSDDDYGHLSLMVKVQLIQRCICFDRLRAVSSLRDLIYMRVILPNTTAHKCSPQMPPVQQYNKPIQWRRFQTLQPDVVTVQPINNPIN